MIVNILLFILVFLLPAHSEAAYKIYLKNGSVITGASSYEKKGSEYIINFGAGSLGISETEVLKIEETESPVMEFTPKEIPEKQGEEKEKPPIEAPPEDKDEKVKELKTELDSIDSELKSIEDREEKLRASIEEKRGEKLKWNPYQRHLLDKEMQPLQDELSKIQERKTELLQRKAYIEGQMRSSE
jgi:prefoldin subunit 5